MAHGPETHLCPRCQKRRDKGWLAEPFVLECVECGVNSIDHPRTEGPWMSSTDESGEQVTFCRECCQRITGRELPRSEG